MIVTLDLSECGVLGRRKCIVTNNLDHKYVPVPVLLDLSEYERVLSALRGGNVPNNHCICTPSDVEPETDFLAGAGAG